MTKSDIELNVYSDAYDVTVQGVDHLGHTLANLLLMAAPTELEMQRVGEILDELERRVHLRCPVDYDCHGGDYACFYGRRGAVV